MVKKTKLFALPKFGSLRGSTSASLKIGEIWQSAKIWQVFEAWGRTYFTLLVDRFITYTNKISDNVAVHRMTMIAGRAACHRNCFLLQDISRN